VGKSTIASAVAERLGLISLDLDAVITEREKESPAEIIRNRGEAAFREVEHAALASIEDPALIALGGGTLTHAPSRKVARSKGPVLGLFAAQHVLESRLARGGDRPLLSVGLSTLLSSRERTYRCVDKRIDATGSVEQVASSVEAAASDLILLRATAGDVESRIIVGSDLSDACAGAIVSLEPKRPVLAVVDAGVPSDQRETYLASIRAVASTIEIAVEGGESIKTWARLGAILEHAIAEGCGRQSVVVGIGGGATCDLSAMAGSLLGRGAPVVLVPSTLLAQLDASIGGKTAINHGGRNLVGTFHPATDVVIDVKLTRSQVEADYRAGLAELIKIALVGDPELFDEVVRLRTASASTIAKAVAHKARIVERDPRESDLRKVLNLGHTLAHGIEAASRYQIRHGEAVAIGIAAIARFSTTKGWLSPQDRDRILTGLEGVGLPTSAANDLLVEAGQHIKADKKGTKDEIDLIVIRAVGNVAVVRLPWAEVQTDLIRCGGET
jgi:3-dehydroquinate synthetase/shikimate kinase